MKKKVSIQDITTSRRSIQDISMADIGRDQDKNGTPQVVTHHIKKHADEPVQEIFNHHKAYSRSHSHKPRWGMVGIWLVIILLCIGGFVFASSFFYGAEVNIKIKEAIAEVNMDVNMARKDDAGVLPFEIVSLSKESSEVVPAKGEKQVSVKATGKIVVYNKNLVSQKLIAQTRFQAASGKIYRITQAVTVPAGKKSGTTITPGSLEVSVTADVAGPEYNAPLTDFTIPGFKGTAKFETIYARSKTPIEGGASGMVKIANPEDLEKAQSTLQKTLETELMESAKQQIPDSYILLPDINVINYSVSTQESRADTLVLKQKAEFVGILVDVKKLSMFLAQKSIPAYSGEEVFVDNLETLIYENVGSKALNVSTETISIKIKGKPHFIYSYDVNKLKEDLVGLSKESFATVIATYPAIEKGNSEIAPFWRSKFPSDLAKITINEEK